jgi:hypothetical protein
MLSGSRTAQARLQGDSAAIVGVVVAAAWAMLAIAALRGAVPVPHAPLVFVLGPLAAGAALIAARQPPAPTIVMAVAGAALAASALIGTYLIDRHELVAIGIPVALAAGVVASRFPAAVTVCLLAFTGAIGTISVYTDLAPAYVVDVPLAGLICAVIWRFAFDPARQSYVMPVSIAIAFLYVAISSGQVLTAPSVSLAQQSFHQSTWHLLAMPAIAFAGWPIATRLRIARGYLVVVGIFAAYAVLRLIIGPADAERELALRLVPINILSSGDLGLFGSTTNRQQLAAWCGMAIPFCAAIALLGSGRWRLAGMLSASLSGVALIGSQTRVGLVGAVIGLAAVLILYALARAFPRAHLGLSIVSAAAVLMAFAIGFAVTDGGSQEVKTRYTAIVAPGTDPSFEARRYTWSRVIDRIESRPGGYGIGAAGSVARRQIQISGDPSSVGGNAIDNSYLKVGFEQGLVVMIVFTLVIALTFGALCRLGATARDPTTAAVAIGAAGAFASFAVNLLLTDNVEDFTALTAWVLAGLGLAGLRLDTAEGRPEGEEAE